VAGAEAYLRAKFHLDPSSRLATDTNVTDRQQIDIQLTDSIGRTVLQTVAPKWFISLIYVPKFPLEERFEFGGTTGDIADVITNVKCHVSRFRLLEVTTSRQYVIPIVTRVVSVLRKSH